MISQNAVFYTTFYEKEKSIGLTLDSPRLNSPLLLPPAARGKDGRWEAEKIGRWEKEVRGNDFVRLHDCMDAWMPLGL
jgi:hypothetical protein